MTELIVCRAPSGYGKSTYANKHFVSKGYVQFEADSFFMKDGKYTFDRTKLGIAHKTCQDNVRQALLNGQNVVVSNTSVTCSEVRDYQKIAQECKVNFRVIRLCRQFQNVHSVPAEIVESMKNRFQDWNGEEMVISY